MPATTDPRHRGKGVRKNERLEVRVSQVQKELAQRAAQLQGRTLSEFVATSVQEAAEQAIRTHAILTLTAQESRIFVEALLAAPAPNAQLRALAERYRKTTISDAHE